MQRIVLLILALAGLLLLTRSTAQQRTPERVTTLRVIYGAYRLEALDVTATVRSEGLIGLRPGLGSATAQTSNGWQAKFSVPKAPPPYATLVGGEGGGGGGRFLPVPWFLIEVREDFTAGVEVSTAKGDFRFRVSEITTGSPQRFLDGLVRVERVPPLTPVATTPSDEDYPAMTAAPNGDVWITYISFGGTGERLYLQKLGAPAIPVTDGLIEAFRPQVAVDSAGRVWVVWSEQRRDNWDLYARAWHNNSWSDIHRLTNSPGPDVYASLTTDAKGTLWLTWQGVRDGKQSDILVLQCRDGKWSSTGLVIGPHTANDWQPSIAAAPDGVYVAWDSYRNGTYDVFLSRLDGQPVRITGGDRFHARPSIAADAKGRIWIAWEEGGEKWGQDIVQTNGGLNRERQVRIAVYHQGKLTQPAQIHHPNWTGAMSEQPRLQFDAAGRLWLFYRFTFMQRMWMAAAAVLSGDTWSDPIILDRSLGRQSVHFSSTLTPSGDVWVAYAGDDRTEARFFAATHNNVYASRIPTAGTARSEPDPGKPLTVPPAATRSFSRTWPNHTITSGGKSFKVVWGELHRHTDIDHHGRPDGTVEDAFRYARDSAGLDFFATTEHITPAPKEGALSETGMNPMTWWRTQKFSDLHRVAGVFEPLYAYESSKTAPQGHRNIVFPRRGGVLFGGITGPTQTDPRPLWAALRRASHPSVAIPHQLTDSGVDWSLNDPDLTPVMEIYQSRRQNYEYDGAPQPPGVEQRWGKRAGSWAWDALAKGYRIGFIASSDHMSSHMSYAAVYTEDLSREGVFEALRQRHTYAASENIIVDFRLVAGAREYIMGDEARITGAPRFRMKIIGMRPVETVEIVRNGQFVFTAKPGTQQVSLEFNDAQFPAGEAYYYLRVRQVDGNMAWSSPIWVTR